MSRQVPEGHSYQQKGVQVFFQRVFSLGVKPNQNDLSCRDLWGLLGGEDFGLVKPGMLEGERTGGQFAKVVHEGLECKLWKIMRYRW
jgi:hypothetical protein